VTARKRARMAASFFTGVTTITVGLRVIALQVHG
jgi:hypothetical protein